MIKIDEDQTTIRLTKGDITTNEYNKLALRCTYYDLIDEEEKDYLFQLTDKISFVVFTKKGYTREEVLRKDYTIADIGYTEPTTCPELPLTELDTKVFPQTNKPKTYWYDVVLNDTTTVIGYDEDGAKKLIVYPEADEE